MAGTAATHAQAGEKLCAGPDGESFDVEPSNHYPVWKEVSLLLVHVSASDADIPRKPR